MLLFLYRSAHFTHCIQKNEDWRPTVTPADFKMNLQQCKRPQGFQRHWNMCWIQRAHLYLQSKGPKQQLLMRTVLYIAIHPGFQWRGTSFNEGVLDTGGSIQTWTGLLWKRYNRKKSSNEKKKITVVSTQGNETDVSSVLGILCEVKQCWWNGCVQLWFNLRGF